MRVPRRRERAGGDMRVAIPLYHGKLAARFEHADEILFADFDNGAVATRREALAPGALEQRLRLICDRGARILVCCRPRPSLQSAAAAAGLNTVAFPLLTSTIPGILDDLRWWTTLFSFSTVHGN